MYLIFYDFSNSVMFSFYSFRPSAIIFLKFFFLLLTRPPPPLLYRGSNFCASFVGAVGAIQVLGKVILAVRLIVVSYPHGIGVNKITSH